MSKENINAFHSQGSNSASSNENPEAVKSTLLKQTEKLLEETRPLLYWVQRMDEEVQAELAVKELALYSGSRQSSQIVSELHDEATKCLTATCAIVKAAQEIRAEAEAELRPLQSSQTSLPKENGRSKTQEQAEIELQGILDANAEFERTVNVTEVLKVSAAAQLQQLKSTEVAFSQTEQLKLAREAWSAARSCLFAAWLSKASAKQELKLTKIFKQPQPDPELTNGLAVSQRQQTYEHTTQEARILFEETMPLFLVAKAVKAEAEGLLLKFTKLQERRPQALIAASQRALENAEEKISLAQLANERTENSFAATLELEDKQSLFASSKSQFDVFIEQLLVSGRNCKRAAEEGLILSGQAKVAADEAIALVRSMSPHNYESAAVTKAKQISNLHPNSQRQAQDQIKAAKQIYTGAKPVVAEAKKFQNEAVTQLEVAYLLTDKPPVTKKHLVACQKAKSAAENALLAFWEAKVAMDASLLAAERVCPLYEVVIPDLQDVEASQHSEQAKEFNILNSWLVTAIREAAEQMLQAHEVCLWETREVIAHAEALMTAAQTSNLEAESNFEKVLQSQSHNRKPQLLIDQAKSSLEEASSKMLACAFEKENLKEAVSRTLQLHKRIKLNLNETTNSEADELNDRLMASAQEVKNCAQQGFLALSQAAKEASNAAADAVKKLLPRRRSIPDAILASQYQEPLSMRRQAMGAAELSLLAWISGVAIEAKNELLEAHESLQNDINEIIAEAELLIQDAQDKSWEAENEFMDSLNDQQTTRTPQVLLKGARQALEEANLKRLAYLPPKESFETVFHGALRLKEQKHIFLSSKSQVDAFNEHVTFSFQEAKTLAEDLLESARSATTSADKAVTAVRRCNPTKSVRKAKSVLDRCSSTGSPTYQARGLNSEASTAFMTPTGSEVSERAEGFGTARESTQWLSTRRDFTSQGETSPRQIERTLFGEFEAATEVNSTQRHQLHAPLKPALDVNSEDYKATLAYERCLWDTMEVIAQAEALMSALRISNLEAEQSLTNVLEGDIKKPQMLVDAARSSLDEANVKMEGCFVQKENLKEVVKKSLLHHKRLRLDLDRATKFKSQTDEVQKRLLASAQELKKCAQEGFLESSQVASVAAMAAHNEVKKLLPRKRNVLQVAEPMLAIKYQEQLSIRDQAVGSAELNLEAWVSGIAIEIKKEQTFDKDDRKMKAEDETLLCDTNIFGVLQECACLKLI